MDRLAKLRVVRGSSGLNDSSVSTISLGTGAGYETANDDSLASSASMYFSANETEDLDQIEEPTLLDEEEDDDILTAAAATSAAPDASVQDHTLENDFSVEEVSTIRKVTIAQASPATVKVASGMAVKYLGVSSTPAAKPTSPRGSNLSGVAPLLEDKKDTPSVLKKLRDPKTPECFSSEEDAEESKANLDSSAVPPAPNKSFGTNVLSNFFESLNVKGTPVPDAPPEIKVIPASEDKTPTNRRDSRRLETFFESLKKEPAQPAEEEKENKKTIRRSLIPTRAVSAERLRPRTSLLGSATKQHRVASPIARPPRKSSLVKLIPDQLKEMRRANLVSVKPPGTRIVPPQIKPPPGKEEIVGDSVRVNGLRKSLAVPSSSKIAVGPAVAALSAKRKSVVPAPVASRRSVLPAKVTRRTIAPAVATASTAPPPKVALKIPAKTTVSSSDVTTRRTSLGKRSISALNPSEKAEPSSKLRKSLAPVKEVAAAPPQKPAPPPSRIRPPTTTSAASTAFKKPETFSCEHCQRIFRLKSSYETHLKTVHQSGSSSTSSTSGNNNKSTESVSTELKCQYCAKGFAGAKFLANHVVTNCVKIPPLEKRKLLAQDEQQRAALVTAAKRTPETRRLIRPPSAAAGSSGAAGNRSNSSVRSGDETGSDTSTTSNPGDKRKKRISTTVGHGGITRTPKKEIKCHLCARRFLNAVEYALHVQAHAKGAAGGGEDKVAEQVEAMTTEADSAGTKEATELVQKLAALRGRAKK